MNAPIPAPSTLNEALALLAQAASQGTPLDLVAGGPEALAARTTPPRNPLLLHNLAALGDLEEWEGSVGLGPLLTPARLLASAELTAGFPKLIEVIRALGASSLGEHLLSPGPDPLRDALAELGAEVTLIGPNGMREVPLVQLCAPGPPAMEADELPLRINIPRR